MRERKGGREGETDRQPGRKTGTERLTNGKIDRQAGMQAGRQADAWLDRHLATYKERERVVQKDKAIRETGRYKQAD